MYIFYFIVTQIALLFLAINADVLKEAQIFLLLSLTGTVAYLIAKVVVSYKGMQFPIPPIWEKTTVFGEIPHKINVILWGFFIILGAFTFVSIGKTSTFEVITAPVFQIIPMSTSVSIALSVFAAEAENLFFFAVIPTLIFGGIYLMTKNFYLSFIVTILFAPGIFSIFHLSRAGESVVISTSQGQIIREFSLTTTYLFGVAMIGWVLLMRNMMLPLVIHAFNNAAVNFFVNYVADFSLYFYIIMVIIIFLVARSVISSPTRIRK